MLPSEFKINSDSSILFFINFALIKFFTVRKVFLLNSCSTCQRIIKEVGIDDSFELQNIKEKNITAQELEIVKNKVGSYEALFSRRAMKYRAMGLHEQDLKEDDFQKLILEEYTFLKRLVIFYDNEIFVGNSKKVVAAAKMAISG